MLSLRAPHAAAVAARAGRPAAPRPATRAAPTRPRSLHGSRDGGHYTAPATLYVGQARACARWGAGGCVPPRARGRRAPCARAPRCPAMSAARPENPPPPPLTQDATGSLCPASQSAMIALLEKRVPFEVKQARPGGGGGWEGRGGGGRRSARGPAASGARPSAHAHAPQTPAALPASRPPRQVAPPAGDAAFRELYAAVVPPGAGGRGARPPLLVRARHGAGAADARAVSRAGSRAHAHAPPLCVITPPPPHSWTGPRTSRRRP